MRVTTLFNWMEKFKSFVYTDAKIDEVNGTPSLVVDIKPRKNSKPICSQCHRPGSVYDHQKPRHFEHVPLYGLHVFFNYSMRRVNCRHCQSIKVEKVPWAD